MRQIQTITDEYLQQNKLLHETDAVYGVGSWRWAQKVLELRDDTQSETVLDYGCGKGRLRSSLGDPEWFFEYDPCVPGKDERPKAADLVVCTDVLEHIEPELLDNVLTDIARLSRRAVFLVIAAREAEKSLPDGTNTHKIIEGPEWWKAKLQEKFLISDFSHSMGEIVVLAATIRQIGEVVAKSAVSETIRFEQAARNCGVVKARVFGNEKMPRHDGRVCIVGYAPSLKHTWHYLQVERRAFGAKIVTTSGAHDFLIERGIIPDIHIDIDPRVHKAHFTRNPHPDVKYWMASCVHPKLIDNLVEKGADVALWHVLNNDNDFKIVEKGGPDEGAMLICGGSGVGCRAQNVMFTAGFRSLSLYGHDCSFEPDGEQHAGYHSGKKQMEWRVKVGDRWFLTSATLVYTARTNIQNFKTMRQSCAEAGEPFIPGTKDRVELFFHGDGLLPAMAQEIERQALQEAAA